MSASVEFSNIFKTFGQLYNKIALFLLCLLTLISCQSDFSVTDKKETRVVIDSFIQSNKVEELDVLDNEARWREKGLSQLREYVFLR